MNVRWRQPLTQHTWCWRCPACGINSNQGNACVHIFAAAIDLARDLLGLTAAGVYLPTDEPEGIDHD